MKEYDLVLYKGRKCMITHINPNKTFGIVLMPGEKPIVKGIEVINQWLRVNKNSLTLIEK